MAVTIKEIASRSGYSVATVSQVINQSGRISSKTRDKIMAVCDELGFRPNMSARNLRYGRFNNITFLIGENRIGNQYPLLLLGNMMREFASRGYTLTIATVPDTYQENKLDMPKCVREGVTDGVLVNVSISNHEYLFSLLRQSKIPYLAVNLKSPDNAVYPNDFNGAFLATEHLLKLGHSQITYIDLANDLTSKQCHYSYIDRSKGYEAAMSNAGFDVRIINQPLARLHRFEFLKDFFGSSNPPSACVFNSNTIIQQALHAALALNLKVPGDLSFVNVADEISSYLTPPITTFAYDKQDMCRQAMETLVFMIENPNSAPPKSVVLPYSLLGGESTQAV